MRLRRVVPAAVAAVVLCLAPTAAAHPPGKADGPLVAPVDRIDGRTGADLLAESWRRSLESAVPTPTGGCVALGKAYEVVPSEESNTADCTVPAGAKLVAFPGAECSNVEDPPFFGADAAAQAACARAWDLENISSQTVSIDGGPPVQTRDPRFELLTRQVRVQLPEGNVLGVPAGPATFVAHAWAFEIIGLRPGTHTILFHSEGSEDYPDITTTVHVTPPCH